MNYLHQEQISDDIKIPCTDCNKSCDPLNPNGEIFGDLHLVEDDEKDWSQYFYKNDLLCEPCIEKRFNKLED